MGQPSPPPLPSNQATTAITLFVDTLRHIQKVDAEFPIQYALCLAEIAMTEGCSITQLAERTGLALSTVSRIVGALSDDRQRGKPYGFIEVKVAKDDPRRREIFLTPLGQSTLDSFLTALKEKV